MSRLLLEISPQRSDETDPGGELPPIVICSPQTAIPQGLGLINPVVLRVVDGGYSLQQGSEPFDAPMQTGEWREADGWRLRVVEADGAAGQGVSIDGGGASWAAPELRVTTYDGDRTKRTRCMLPVDDGSQLVVGRLGSKADLIIDDEHISRAHLRFFVSEGQQFAEDLGSKWGTKLNGLPLTDPQPLKHGDEIRLGKSLISYVCYWDILPKDEAPPMEPEPGMAPVGRAGETALPTTLDENPEKLPLVSQEQSDKVPPQADPVATAPKNSVARASQPDEEKLAVDAQPVIPMPATPATPIEAVSPLPPAVSPTGAVQKSAVAGSSMGWAVMLVLLLIGGMVYLAYKVFAT